ncbi:hypothetical protein [Apilactobacillus apinorum]|uniref:Monooxygenase n=1 Tax=Apilactobacillus apinorum TaxID=1218495 RepID=A0ABP9ZFY3_9LACO|nr:hypothetical protein [Apilactobacillus apinorum]KOY68679.1 hypothetical protein RZ74_08890 [Apilactobacillus apinorum]CAI2682391.1 Hypothetical protein AAPFHON13_09420 [Apilactobacillus apinorum]
MNNQISMTFGNKFIVDKLKKANPELDLSLFNSGDGQYQIIDFQGNHDIFKNNIIFDVIFNHDFFSNINFVNYSYFNLSDDDKKVFDAIIEKIKNDASIHFLLLKETRDKKRFVLASSWKNYFDFKSWQKDNQLLNLAELSLNYKKA